MNSLPRKFNCRRQSIETADGKVRTGLLSRTNLDETDFIDEKGNPLNGANSYKIHFDKANLPPVKAFWSVTLYDPEGFQVANSLNRFAVSSWMPFAYNADGSLDLYFQNKSPGEDKEANWLPAPAGPFNLTMRLYGPESEALTGKWNPPVVELVPALQQVTAQ